MPRMPGTKKATSNSLTKSSGRRAAPTRVSLRSTLSSSSSIQQRLVALAGALFTVAFAIFMLTITTTHPGVIFGPDVPTRLIAFELIAVSLLLALASGSSRVRLTLQMVMIYMTIYLILPGYHHSSMNTFPFYGMHYEMDIRMRAAVMIAVFIIALMVGYLLGDEGQRIGRTPKMIKREIVFPSQTLLMLFTILAILATGLYLAKLGTSAFGQRSEIRGGGALSSGLFLTMPRMITFVSFAYCYILFMRSQKVGLALYYLVVNAPFFLITNFPLALARYTLFGIILFFVVQTVDLRTAKARSLLSFAFVFGALFAMPYVDSLTRHLGSSVSVSVTQAYDKYLTSGDFDGLQSIQNAVIFNNQNGTTNGLQTLSAVLFFVPRSIWEAKGDPTGVITSRAAGFAFNNISQPLPSELFVDFGMIGMGLCSVLIGFWMARFDGWVDRNWDAGPRARLLAGVVVAYGIIVMRGALLGIVPPVALLAAGVGLIIRLGLRSPEKLILRMRSDGPVIQLSPRTVRLAKAAGRLR